MGEINIGASKAKVITHVASKDKNSEVARSDYNLETDENDEAPAANDTPAQGPTVTRKDLISKKEDVQINALR